MRLIRLERIRTALAGPKGGGQDARSNVAHRFGSMRRPADSY